MRRYDADSDGRLVYSDFCDAFVPRHPDFGQMLGGRRAEWIHRPVPPQGYFSYETRETINQLWRVHFELEESMELIKQRLSRRPKFNPRDAFDTLDVHGLGFITLESMRALLS